MASSYLDHSQVTEVLKPGTPTADYYMVVYDNSGPNLRRTDVGAVVTTRTPDDVRWTDLRAPASSINPAGQAAGADIDATDSSLLFASNATETAAVILQMPHEWKEGSEIRPHIHWSKTSDAAGGVEWEYRYRVFNVGDVVPAWSDWLAADSQSSDPGATQAMVIDGFPDIDMTGFTLSAMISVAIRRNVDATDDTYAADAKLWEFDIHYQIDSRGSAEEFVK